jgi:uncharacterized protein YtpQ (UPF0354 family)
LHHRLRRATDRHPPEIAAFLLQFETELAAAHPNVTYLGLLPDRFACLLRVDQQETVVGLQTAFRHAEAYPSQFAAMVKRLLGDVREVGLDHLEDIDFAAAAPQLMPQVRTQEWLSQRGTFGDSGLVYRPLSDELVTVYVIDDAQSMVFVCRAHLRRWRKSEDDLHNLAVANLARTGRPQLPAAMAQQPLLLQSGDGFDAARVLLLEPADGLLVALPDRDTLWVGAADGQNLERLMATTEAIADQSLHPVSKRVFRVTDGQLAALPAHPAE